MLPEEVGKGLDATKEVAVVAGKALDTVNGFGRFLERVLGPPMSEAGGYLGDQIAFWRQMNVLKFAHKLQQRCEQLGLDPETIKPIPLSLTYRVLEGASLEETDEIQELWAELLAKSIDPATDFVATKMHISLLKELTPVEATLLQALAAIELLIRTPVPLESSQSMQETINDINKAVNAALETKWKSFSSEDRAFAVRNLLRLGCITQAVLELPDLSNLFQEITTPGRNRYNGLIVATKVDTEVFRRLIEVARFAWTGQRFL